MKKLTGILTALVLFVSASSFAPNEEIVSAKIKSAFEKTFTSASEVKWNKSDGFYFANFKINQQVLTAAFNDEGELVGASRNISLSQLPMNVSLALQNHYADYTIASVTEMTTEGQTNYYIAAENSKRIVTIKADAFGDLSIHKKTKKK